MFIFAHPVSKIGQKFFCSLERVEDLLRNDFCTTGHTACREQAPAHKMSEVMSVTAEKKKRKSKSSTDQRPEKRAKTTDTVAVTYLPGPDILKPVVGM